MIPRIIILSSLEVRKIHDVIRQNVETPADINIRAIEGGIISTTAKLPTHINNVIIRQGYNTL